MPSRLCAVKRLNVPGSLSRPFENYNKKCPGWESNPQPTDSKSTRFFSIAYIGRSFSLLLKPVVVKIVYFIHFSILSIQEAPRLHQRSSREAARRVQLCQLRLLTILTNVMVTGSFSDINVVNFSTLNHTQFINGCTFGKGHLICLVKKGKNAKRRILRRTVRRIGIIYQPA